MHHSGLVCHSRSDFGALEKRVGCRNKAVRVQQTQAVIATDQKPCHVGDRGWIARLPLAARHPREEVPLWLLVVQQLAQLHPDPCLVKHAHIDGQ